MYKTKQEDFWAGQFGNDYIGRNRSETFLAANMALFSKIFATHPLTSLVEFGANIGNNLDALRLLFPKLELSAIEINADASKALRDKAICKEVFEQSILDFAPAHRYDAVLIKGVLIHINPEMLPSVYDKLYASSSKYICLVEYYNPSPVQIPYRGHEGFLFKRDFAGEMMERFPDLQLLDYGFVYRNDPNFPQDDLTWFLLKKERL